MSGYAQPVYINDSITPPISGPNLNKTEAGVNAALGYDSLQEIRDIGTPSNSVETVFARGYSVCGDGGSGTFFLQRGSAGQYVDDDGMTILPAGGDGSAAWVRDTTTYRPEMFGARNDGTNPTATCAAFEALAEYLYNTHGGGVIDCGSAEWGINRTIVFPPYVSCIGDGVESTTFRINTGGTFIDNFVFFVNLINDGSDFVEEFLKLGGKFASFEIDNNDYDVSYTAIVTGLRGFLYHGGYEFENIRFTRMSQAIKRLDYSGALFVDETSVNRVNYRWADDITTYWAIDLRNGGDGVKVSQCDFVKVQNLDAYPQGIYLDKCNGAKIDNILNGHHYIARSHGMSMENMHIEGGFVTIASSSVAIKDSVLFHQENLPKIIFEAFEESGPTVPDDLNRHGQSQLNNVEFWHRPGLAIDNDFDIRVGGAEEIEIRDCRRVIAKTIDYQTAAGIRVAKADGTGLDDFNSYSHICSRNSFISANNVSQAKGAKVSFSMAIESESSAYANFYNSSNEASIAWLAASGDYYYSFRVLTDPVRMIGNANSDTIMESAVNGGSAIALRFNSRDVTDCFILRLYRGTSAGSYNNYVDLPYIGGRVLFDDGERVGGFAWVSRTPADIDSINAMPLKIQVGNQQAACWGGWLGQEYPIYGEWSSGDMYYRIGNAIDGTAWRYGAIRITSGSAHVSGTDWRSLRFDTTV